LSIVGEMELFNLIIDVFLKCKDKEISVSAIEIVACLCNSIVLEKLQNANDFCMMLIQKLRSENDIVAMAAITSLRNLIIT